MDRIRILLVEDNRDQADLVEEYLNISGTFDIDWAPTLADLWGAIQAKKYDVILLDYLLPDGNGLQALTELRAHNIDTPVIMITGQGDERIVVQAMQAGAVDYLVKGKDELTKLPTSIQKAMHEYLLQHSIERSLEKIRYQALLLNNVRDAIVVWDKDNNITYWNAAAEAIMGSRAKDCLGTSVEKCYLQAFDPPVRIPPREGTSGMTIERRFQNGAGETIWVSSRVSTLRDHGAGGRVVGYMDVIRDISEQKKAQEALRINQERYSLATAAGKVGVWDWNIKTNEFYLDPNLKRLLGYSDEEIPNDLDAWSALIHPEDYEVVMEAARAHIRGETPEYQYEHRMMHKDGSIRWIYVHGRRILDSQGEVVRLIGTDSDITERKNMEAQIKAAQNRLANSARLAAVGELASGVAHHINNPLTTIIAESQLLLHTFPQDHPERESAELIEKAGWRVQQAVKQLIDFSRPPSQELESLSINETIHNAVELIGDQVRSANIEIVVETGEHLPEFQGNAHRLGILWVNLLLLARDGSQNGSNHTIRVRSCTDQDGNIQVEVIDNGSVIPKADLETIFESDFIKAPGGRGTGIEFNICQEIVRQHGGEIYAESDIESGTIVKILFPAEV